MLLLVAAPSAFAQNALKKEAPLKVRAQVQVAAKQRRINDSYRKAMDIEPKVILDGQSRIAPIPAAEATMVIITMDTREKYTNKNQVFSVLTTETIPVAAQRNGARRTLEFQPSKVTFDSYRDTSNVGGAVYKYYIFALRDAETKELADFQTNYAKLDEFCKANPGEREKFLALKPGEKLPEEFK
ncbi:MAG: hypothetical protein ABI680_17420 [Chthoniobacteraceae bacterium]